MESLANEVENVYVEGDDVEDAMGRVNNSILKQARREVFEEVVDGVIDAGEKATGNKSGRMRRLLRVFVKKAIPMGIFGFIDNLLMVLIGNYLDSSIAKTLGVGTMAAAGLGNAASDAIGALGQDRIENVLKKVGLGEEDTDVEDKKYESFAGMAGGAVGVIVGCLVGMFPLMFTASESEVDEEIENRLGCEWRGERLDG